MDEFRRRKIDTESAPRKDGVEQGERYKP